MLNKLKKTLNLLLTDIAEIYPYLLLFYVVSILVSHFIPAIRLFFYWPAFHISMVVLGALSLLSPALVRLYVVFKKKIKGSRKVKGFFSMAKIGLALAVSMLIKRFKESKNKAKNSRKIKGFFFIIMVITLFLLRPFMVKNRSLRIFNAARITAIVMIMAYAYSKSVNVYDFSTLLFALISVLFVIDSRISAGVAILLLIACPIFLAFKEDILAEDFAIYAFYFLVITVLTQIGESRREKPQ